MLITGNFKAVRWLIDTLKSNANHIISPEMPDPSIHIGWCSGHWQLCEIYRPTTQPIYVVYGYLAVP